MKTGPPRRRARTGKSDEVTRLRGLLAEAHSTLHAIRDGEVDAVVVDSKLGPRIYTLAGAEFDYRVLIESMNEGALVLTHDALVLYANRHFARMVGRRLPQIMGRSVCELLSPADGAKLRRLLKRSGSIDAATDVHLRRARGKPVPARVALRRFPANPANPANPAKNTSIGMVVSDLTEFRNREEILRSFSRSLLQLQETERVQIATDLGDNIAQMLCSILVRCQVLASKLPAQQNGFRKESREFTRLLRTTADEVHRISVRLRPHGLEILGLVSALRAVAAEFAERMGVSIEVDCARMTTRLPAETELALYRVLQEALRNVEQHSLAQHVAVSLKRRGSVVRLTVKDDGIGFEMSEQQALRVQEGRFGLLSMHERATAVGGSLRVKSDASAGTEIRADVPLPTKNGTAR